MEDTYIVVILALVGFSLIFIGLSTYLLVEHLEQRSRCTERVDAMVVDVISYRSSNHSGHYRMFYKPVFQFLMLGSMQKVTSPVAYSPALYQVGDTVQLLCNPENPKDIVPVKERGKLVLPFTFLTFGIVSASVAIAFALGICLGVIS